MKVYVVTSGYYENNHLDGIGATYEAAARIAEQQHPQHDDFFGTDPTCPHWLGRRSADGLWDCDCTTEIAEIDVEEA